MVSFNTAWKQSISLLCWLLCTGILRSIRGTPWRKQSSLSWWSSWLFLSQFSCPSVQKDFTFLQFLHTPHSLSMCAGPWQGNEKSPEPYIEKKFWKSNRTKTWTPIPSFLFPISYTGRFSSGICPCFPIYNIFVLHCWNIWLNHLLF